MTADLIQHLFSSALLKCGVGLASLAATLAEASQFEGDFQPYFNGKYIAWVVKNELSLPIPTEGLELSASVAVRIRDSSERN